MVYKLIQILLKIYLPLFFKKVEVRGLNNVPRDKPVLFAVNHQNTFLDAMLVGMHLNRQVYFLTRSDVFRGKIALKIFDALNLVPIFRKKDGDSDFKNKNKETFDYCIDKLEQGKPILIFPEGYSEPIHHLFPLKKGVARLALEAESKHNFNFRLHIVTVAVNYENHFLPGKGAFVEYSEPIIVSNYKNIFNENPSKARSKLLLDVTRELKNNVVHIDGDYMRFKRRYWKGIIRHSRNDKEMVAALKSIPVEDKTFSKKGFSWRKEKYKYELERSVISRLFYFAISLPGLLLFLPTILITKLINWKVNDESFYLSILSVCWLLFGLIQVIVNGIYLSTVFDYDFVIVGIILSFGFGILSLRNFNKIL